MGATASQGWYLFTFLVGFTLAPAGFVALGWPVALVGLVLMVGALAGFVSIKEPANRGPSAREYAPGLSVGRSSEKQAGGGR
jgi:hypothetical protein